MTKDGSMCCSGQCKWERNDYVNGGTSCMRPLRLKRCPHEETGDEDEYLEEDEHEVEG